MNVVIRVMGFEEFFVLDLPSRPNEGDYIWLDHLDEYESFSSQLKTYMEEDDSCGVVYGVMYGKCTHLTGDYSDYNNKLMWQINLEI
jgi:hypothetical protein